MASDIEMVQMLMQELGPEMPDIEMIVRYGDSGWQCQFLDEIGIAIEWLDLPSRLLLTATLGKIATKNPLPIYEAFLAYNLLPTETGGIRLGLTGPGGDVKLLCEINAIQMSMYELKEGLSHVKKLSSVWKKIVSDPTIGEEEVEDMMQSALWMRG